MNLKKSNKPWAKWLTEVMLSEIYKAEQQKYAKDILPARQAIISEETVELDEEHCGGCGPKGEDGFRGTI